MTEITGGRGVDISFATAGGKVLEQCFKCTRAYGDIVTLLQPGADTDWKQPRMYNQRLSLELMLLRSFMAGKRHWPIMAKFCVNARSCSSRGGCASISPKHFQ